MNLLQETNTTNHQQAAEWPHDGSPDVYTVGFLFDWNFNVLLIKKVKPEWQRGRYNGLGGKIKDEETPLENIKRKFKEESGIPEEFKWRYFATVTNQNRDFIVFFFEAMSERVRPKPTNNPEEEKCEWIAWNASRNIPLVKNLTYLIPLAIHKDNPVAFIVEE